MRTAIFKPLFLFLVFTFFTSFLFSQNKKTPPKEVPVIQDKKLGLKDITNTALYPDFHQLFSEMQQLQWMKIPDAYSYIKGGILYSGTIKGKTDKEIASLIDLNKAMLKKGLKELKRFPGLTWIDEVSFRFVSEDQLLAFDIKKKEVYVVCKANATAEHLDIETKNFSMAFTRDNNLYIYKDPEGEVAVTNEKDPDIICGQEVHRNEFGIDKGTFWSPKSNYLAFYRMDQTMVTDYPLVNYDERVAKNEPIKYPMAGMTSHQVTLGVYDIRTKNTVYLETGRGKDHYLTNISWSPDEKFIFISLLNRDQNKMQLNQYDIRNGELVKTLFEEENSKWVEPENPLYFLKTNPDRFLYFSKRDGYKHLYLYDIRGELIDQITKGDFDVLEFMGFDEKEENIFYRAVDENFPLQKHLYYINIKSKEVVKLSASEGVHTGMLNAGSKYMIDMYSSPTIPREINIIDANGVILKNIYKGTNSLAEYKLGEIVVNSVKADDGSDLYYRMIKPVNFDPDKKYPVIVYVYGGPHLQLIENSWLWDASLWQMYMAQEGYIVFTLDNHGTPNRGLKFEQAVFRNLGDVEIADQMKGISYLKSLRYVDTTRIGVNGWSYGGFMTVSLKLRQPETFKVAIAGAPVIDWKYYEVMYGERYMDTPESNPEGYKKASLLNYVKNLNGKLMIIHGTSDDTVVQQHSIEFLDECIKNGVYPDYFIYPGQKHSVRGIGRTHLDQMITKYFMNNL
jgi:dipeptidyl-peptidase-4